MPGERVAVVGLGLIGGSLALRLAAAGHDVVGTDRDPATRAAAAAAGLPVAPTVEDALAGRSVAAVAVPVPALPGLLPRVAAAAGPGTVVTDVSSVKVPVRAAWAAAAGDRPVPYVGGHPMAGTATAGFGAADPGLFAGAPWVLCLEEDTDLGAWLRLARLLTGLGAQVVPTRAAEHDAAVARVSGLPHLLALTLARVGAAAGPLALSLAAGSFRDGTRVAGAPPELVATLTDGNRDAVLAAVDEALALLTAVRDTAAAGGSQLAAARAGQADRRRWEAARTPAAAPTLDAAEPGLAAALLALGAAGGRVVAVDGSALRCVRPEDVSARSRTGRSRS